MSLPGHRLLVVDGLRVEVTRRRVKQARLAVRPDGSIRLSAPPRVPDSQLRAFVLSNRDWLLRQVERQRRRLMLADDLSNGGRMLLWGHAVEVVRVGGARASAALKAHAVHITAPDDDGALRAAARLRRQLLEDAVHRLAPPLQERVGEAPSGFRYRAMTSRWGSCNVRTRMITLNTWLVQRPEPEFEYVLAHELTHLVVPSHGAPFHAVMDRVLPGWRPLRAELRKHVPPRG